MSGTGLSRAVRVTAVMIAAAALSTEAQDMKGGWEPPVEAQPVITIHANGAGSGRTWTSSLSGSFAISEADYSGLVVTPGFLGSDLCAGSVLFSTNPQDLDRAAAAWHVEARLMELRHGEATIDLRWTRQVNRPDLVPAERLSWQQHLLVREGDHGVLDIVRKATPSGTGCDTFALTYDVTFAGPRALGEAAIEYDIWLVQRDADGVLTTDRFRATGKQGEQSDFFFRPAPYGVDGRRSVGEPRVDVSVSGSVRGRVRTDGRIDLTVDGELAFSDPEHRSSTSTSGRTLLTVRSGETIEIETIEPKGHLAGAGDLGRIFANHRTAIRITPRRLW